MRTGNALFTLTFRPPDASEVRVTLLDDGVDGVAELIDATAPWEESATVPVEQMSRFRVAAEALPEQWPRVDGEGARLTMGIEANGRTSGFAVDAATPMPAAHRQLIELVADAAQAALVGARSSKALARLTQWVNAIPRDG